MNMKINGKITELEVKRFYMYGVTIESQCPCCKETHTFDGEKDCLDYPPVNEEINISFYCEDCNEEWNEKIILEINVKGVE